MNDALRGSAALDRVRNAASGIFDRVERFTPDQRARLFYLLESRWCWDCGEDQIDHGRECAHQREQQKVPDAWLFIERGSHLKQCPRCGVFALEGEVECSECGARPADDLTWREAAAHPWSEPTPPVQDQ